MNLKKLNENLEFIKNAMSDLNKGHMTAMPVSVGVQPETQNMGSTVASPDPSLRALLESRIHGSFTETADALYGLGYMTQEQRIALSSCIGDALSHFCKMVSEKCPMAETKMVSKDDVKAVLGYDV